MIRPTPKAVVLFGLSVPVALLVVVLFPGQWFVCLYLPVIALALTLADAASALPAGRMRITADAPTRLYVGRPGHIDLDLNWNRRTAETPVEALLEINGSAPPEIRRGVVREGRFTARLPLVPDRRGLLEVTAVWMRWKGPLGLTEIRRREILDRTVEVVPDIQGIHQEALRFFARDAEYGVKSQRQRGGGTEFDTLCEYHPGMDTRFIDWKRSARHRKLLCKEFRQERNHQVMLGFDTGHLMLEPIEGQPRLDHAVRAGLLLGWVSLHSGDLVGSCAFDGLFRGFLKPGRGMHYFTNLQRFAAGLDYREQETNFTLGLAEIGVRLRRRALIVLFTEFVDSIAAELLLESLDLVRRKHVVIFVSMRDPMLAAARDARPGTFLEATEAVVADDFLRERAVVLERVARMGIHTLDVPARGISSALLNRYMMIKQRGLI